MQHQSAIFTDVSGHPFLMFETDKPEASLLADHAVLPLTRAQFEGEFPHALLSLRLPPELAKSFAIDKITFAGYPSEVLAHLRSLPGFWVVMTDLKTGMVLREWPARWEDGDLQEMERLFSGLEWRATDNNPSPFLTRLQGINAWYPAPGNREAAAAWPAQSTAFGSLIIHRALIEATQDPQPPAGGFLGRVAVEYTPRSYDERIILTSRLTTAMEDLKRVKFGGAEVGMALSNAFVANRIMLRWGAPAAGPNRQLPCCGWDNVHQIIYLPVDSDPCLDAVYLGAIGFSAWEALSGLGPLNDLVSHWLARPLRGQSLPSLDLEIMSVKAAHKAARYTLVLAEIARALGADRLAALEGVLLLDSATPARLVLPCLPPADSTGAEYAQAVQMGTLALSKALTPTMRDAMRSSHDLLETVLPRWHQARWLSQTAPDDYAGRPREGAIAQEGSVSKDGDVISLSYRAPTAVCAVQDQPLEFHRRNDGSCTVIFRRDDGRDVQLRVDKAATPLLLSEAAMHELVCIQDDRGGGDPMQAPIARQFVEYKAATVH